MIGQVILIYGLLFGQPAPSGCEPLQSTADQASATLQLDNSAVSTAFDDVRGRAARVAAESAALAQATQALLQHISTADADGRARASQGWNPDMGYADAIAQWATRDAPSDAAALQAAATDPSNGSLPPDVTSLMSLLDVAQQRANQATLDSQPLASALQELSDCQLGAENP
jgi:hypothetical protein